MVSTTGAMLVGIWSLAIWCVRICLQCGCPRVDSRAPRAVWAVDSGAGCPVGVAASTITRIQSGVVDPSVGTLDRLAEIARSRLRLTASGGVDRRVADLVDAWSYRRGRLRLDWPRWRAFLDHLAEIPDVEAAISAAPQPSGSDVVDNLVAAIAERVADEHGSERPHWTTTILMLDEPYRPPVARPRLDRPVPAQLAKRGVMIDSDSLWRRRNR